MEGVASTSASDSVPNDQRTDDSDLEERLSQCSMDSDIVGEEHSDTTKSTKTNKTQDAKEAKRVAKLKKECAIKPYLDGRYFEVVVSESTASNVTAVCQLCEEHKIIKGPLESSSNFVKHLKNAHKRVYPEEYNEHKKSIKRRRLEDGGVVKRRRRGTCAFTQDKYEEGVAKLVLESKLPFSTVELPFFRNFIDDLDLRAADNTPLKHLSRRTLVRRVAELFEEQISVIQTLIKKEATYVCTTSDVWSSSTRSFLGVTAHWIDPVKLIRKSAAIACRRFSGTYSYDRIAELLTAVHSSFDLDTEKIVATVTDNGSNFVKAFREFGISVTSQEISEDGNDDADEQEGADDNDNSASDMDTDIAVYKEDSAIHLPKHLRCASHTLSLIATTDVMKSIKHARNLAQRHDQTIARCNTLWKMLRSPKQREIMTKTMGKALSRPVVVRWNSLFSSLEQIISLRVEINKLNDVIENKTPLREADYDYIAEYLICLRPIAETIDKLQGETYCFYGYLTISLISVQRRLSKILADSNLRYCKPILKGLIESVKTRFSVFFEVEGDGRDAAIAAVLLPMYKSTWLGNFSSESQILIRHALMQAAKSLTGTARTTTNAPAPTQDFFDLGSEPNIFNETNAVFEATDAEIEVLRYMRDPCTQDISTLNAYPYVKQLFLRYNTPLPSSAPVERLFSYATMMNLPQYNRLNDTNFEHRVLAVCNAKQVFE